MTTIVGIDVGQRICHIAVERIGEDVIETKAARSKTPAKVLDLVAGDDRVLVALELTGSLARPVIDELHPHAQIEVYVAQHTDSVAIRTLTRRRYKTDKLDARLIADMAKMLTNPETAPLFGAYLTPWSVIENAINGRIRVRHMQRLTADRARIRTRLKSLTDPTEEAHYEEVEALYTAQIKEAEAALIATAGPAEKLLTSIPGVSVRRACILTGTFGDIANYPTSDNLVAFCGLKPPRRRQSGTKLGKSVRRRATDLLDNELHMFALRIAQHPDRSGTLGETYLRLKTRHGNGIVAMWAVKRKLIRICWGILTSGEPYRGMETAQ